VVTTSDAPVIFWAVDQLIAAAFAGWTAIARNSVMSEVATVPAIDFRELTEPLQILDRG
jgi:hypothetical protein